MVKYDEEVKELLEGKEIEGSVRWVQPSSDFAAVARALSLAEGDAALELLSEWNACYQSDEREHLLEPAAKMN